MQQNHPDEKNDLDQRLAKVQEARIKMIIQTLEIKADTNMTRIYSALQTTTTNHSIIEFHY